MKIILTFLIALILSGCHTQLLIVETQPHPQVLHRPSPTLYVHTQTRYIYYYWWNIPNSVVFRQYPTVIITQPIPTSQPRNSGTQQRATTPTQPRSVRDSDGQRRNTRNN
jgi:hypothetical protein